jgi:hypothetical protein
MRARGPDNSTRPNAILKPPSSVIALDSKSVIGEIEQRLEAGIQPQLFSLIFLKAVSQFPEIERRPLDLRYRCYNACREESCLTWRKQLDC